MVTVLRKEFFLREIIISKSLAYGWWVWGWW